MKSSFFFIVLLLPAHTHTFPKHLIDMIASLSSSYLHISLSHSLIHSRKENLPKKNESCGDTKSCICCITFFVLTEKFRVSSPLPICPLVRLFSLFYDCAQVAVSPCHLGNLLSLLLATHTVCVCVCVQCSHSQIPLLSVCNTRVCMSVCVLLCVQWACLKSSLSVGP